jgi:hypothetical protein
VNARISSAEDVIDGQLSLIAVAPLRHDRNPIAFGY